MVAAFLLSNFGEAAFEDSSHLNSRGAALGGAVLTLGNDGNAPTGNPALLATLYRTEIGLTSRLYGADLAGDSILSVTAQAGMPLSNLAGIGASVNALLNTVNAGGSTRLLYANYLVSIGFGFSLTRFIQVGGSLHARGSYTDPVLTGLQTFQTPLEFNATLGIFTSPFNGLAISLVASRFLGNLVPPQAGGSFRPDNQAAPAIQAAVGTRNRFFIGELGAEYLLNEQKVAFNAGLEKYFFKELFRVSAGVRVAGLNFEVTPSVGIGLQLGIFDFAYTFAYPLSGAIMAGNHLASVIFALRR
ncbi:MAG: hypothetical protein JNM63_06105 [Spirochaetia bacterium]|nr:hypothetical protein [Spirochaetia bacterium]